jgi:hypothetical protein
MWIDIKTKRDVRLFLWSEGNNIAIENYRQSKGIKKFNPNHIYGEDSFLAAQAINEAFLILYKESDALLSYACNFKKSKEALLPSKEFSWFKRCNDACYFAWLFVRGLSNRNKYLVNTTLPHEHIVHARTSYYYLVKNHYPGSHRERIECIEDFFDRFPYDLSVKLSIMSHIRDEWNKHSHWINKLPLKKNDKNKINWTWEYINKDKIGILNGSIKRMQDKYVKESSVPPDLLHDIFSAAINGYIHNPHFLSFFRPSTTTEKYLALRCIYASLYHQDMKFITRLQKAWESSNYREKVKSQSQGRQKTILVSEDNELDSHDVIDCVIPTVSILPDVESPHKKTLIEAINESLIKKEIIPVGSNENEIEIKNDDPPSFYDVVPY